MSTEDNRQEYIGRFAPSPTGPVHFGTLVAAMASYLQAKKNHGKWRLRMEDVDITRKIKGADSAILTTLESYGFQWDGEVIYQSFRTQYYTEALQQLIEQSRVFPCICSRKQLNESGSEVYPGTCRNRLFPEPVPHNLRLHCDTRQIKFNDQIMGPQLFNLPTDCGDFIIKRRDGLFAYQLTVVVDDARQGITEVVRGADLLDSTAKQIYLQQLLDYAQPDYLHIPLAVNQNGQKLSKSMTAANIKHDPPQTSLVRALDFLGQQPPVHLKYSPVEAIWHWAIHHWDITKIPPQKSRPV